MFYFITYSQINQLHKNFSIWSWMNTDYKCLKQSIQSTRSTRTVHTSAKACMIHDPDHHQNLILCSLAYCEPSVKISCKSIQTFMRKAANMQMNNDDYITSLVEVMKQIKPKLLTASLIPSYNSNEKEKKIKWINSHCPYNTCVVNFLISALGQPLPNMSNNSTCVVNFFHQRF